MKVMPILMMATTQYCLWEAYTHEKKVILMQYHLWEAYKHEIMRESAAVMQSVKQRDTFVMGFL